MQRPGTGKKRALYLALACLGVLGLYWLKNLADINLFRHFSLHRYFPFSLLQHDKVILQPRGTVAVKEDFETLLPVPAPWHKLSTNRPRKVQVDYELADDGSRRLVVTSQHEGWWHISHRYALAVEPGDTFTLAGTLWQESAGGYGQLQVSAVDAGGNVMERGMWAIEAGVQGQFQRVEKVFTVPPGVSRIMLRVAGRGAGRFKFDDLSLEPGAVQTRK
ncbi:MAG: hypothetical protein KDI04_02915 [Halieaceae bacterium]|nr:hypothetical protein [Halieaceae bacterium]MCP5148208.1 hypothetical protein [Pseudomonadales bacterium]MCP5188289.1 hypothetical protein [Pseudomonadales bacterium]